jgi:tRNA-2-methylthio-N6-dimethylallyladenosine synthase
LAGRSGGNIIVEFDGGDEKIGEFCQVRVTAARNWILNGELA